MILAEVQHITFPNVSAKWVIGSIALFHTAVASLAIGFAFVVTVLQIVGYRRKIAGYDLLAKRVQLWHVCIYNIGTINAIGLVFVLSGLYPQFWSQIFTQFFWPMIMEEACFFLLATTLTLHYFFWDYLRGHKKLHILLGSLLTPLFLLQFYLINGMAAFMVTPGAGEGQISQWGGSMGILGWDKGAFYNPSFLMLTFHRTLANFSYGAFFVAGVCGTMLYFNRRPKLVDYYEKGGRLSFHVAFVALLALPMVGFFYAWVLKYHAPEAYENLMWGKGDVWAAGVDWWWVKHTIVVGMIGMALVFHWKAGRRREQFSVPASVIFAIGAFYLVFYAGMGMQMTWLFFWAMLAAAVIAGLLAAHLINYHHGSGRAVFVLMGILAFATVMLGGYVREASRPRFVSSSGVVVAGRDDLNRYAHYDDRFRAAERQTRPGPMRMVLERPDDLPAEREWPFRPGMPTPADLISERCIGCHDLQRVRGHALADWYRVVKRMRAMMRQRAWGERISDEEAEKIVRHLKSGQPY